MNVLKKLFFAFTFFASYLPARAMQANDDLWKSFLPDNDFSIPHSHWEEESRDSYVLTSVPNDFINRLSTYGKTLFVAIHFPTFQENAKHGPSSVALSKALSDCTISTSQWRKGNAVIPEDTITFTDMSYQHTGKVVAFFKGRNFFFKRSESVHTGIFLKYHIQNNRIMGFWIADNNWKKDKKIRKHLIAINDKAENTKDGVNNAKNYFFVTIR